MASLTSQSKEGFHVINRQLPFGSFILDVEERFSTDEFQRVGGRRSTVCPAFPFASCTSPIECSIPRPPRDYQRKMTGRMTADTRSDAQHGGYEREEIAKGNDGQRDGGGHG